MIGNDDGPGHGRGFSRDTAKGLRSGRWCQDDVGQGVGRGHVRTMADNRHAPAEPVLQDGVFKFAEIFRAALGIPGEHEVQLLAFQA